MTWPPATHQDVKDQIDLKLAITDASGSYQPKSVTFATSTAYKAGQLAVYSGVIYQAVADFTSGGSFSAADWSAVPSSNEIASASVSSDYTVTASFAAVTGMTITVPAYSGPCEVEVVGGLVQQIVTGTNSTTTRLNYTAQLIDELGNVLSHIKWAIAGTGSTLSLYNTCPLGATVGDSTIDKVYSVQARMDLVGTNSATSLILMTSPFPPKVLRAVRR